MQSQAENTLVLNEEESSGGDPVLLLEEVDFKWLMAGQGWWIDTTRLHSDRSYATRFLRLAGATKSRALRDCAMLLQEQIDGLGACATQ
jgi:hypothetical protein